jgi:hypothetical protein
MTGITSMAELLRKRGIAKDTVSRGTVPFDASASKASLRLARQRARRGHGVDWSPTELAILEREDLRPKDMQELLPGRTSQAIRTKRCRIGVATPYRRSNRGGY